MFKHGKGTYDRRQRSGKKGEALRCLGLRHDARPHHICGEGSNTDETRKIARPVACMVQAEGVHGHDDPEQAGKNREGFPPLQRLPQAHCFQQGGDQRCKEDQDVKERQRKVAQGNDDPDCVRQVKAGAKELRYGMSGPEHMQAPGDDGARQQDQSDCQADRGSDLIRRESGGPNDLEAGIGQDPERVARKRQADGLEVRHGRRQRHSPLRRW